jgi:hypothetical protein
MNYFLVLDGVIKNKLDFFLIFNYIMKNKLENNFLIFFLILLKEQGLNLIDKKLKDEIKKKHKFINYFK